MKTKSPMAGRFRFETFKCDSAGVEISGSRRVVADWFPNLITNNGLDKIGSSSTLSNALSFCYVGTDGTPPTVNDTAMKAPVAYSSQLQSQSAGINTSSDPYAWRRVVHRFGAGAAAGNLQEVGIGFSQNFSDLWSRALILDSMGNPTTLTVLPDEYLDVTYEVRVYIPTGDFTGTIELDGIVYNYIARAANADTYNTSFDWNAENGAGHIGSNSVGRQVLDGPIGNTIFDVPSGSSSQTDDAGAQPYVSGSYEREIEYVFGLDEGNFSGGIRSLYVTAGWGRWQVEFSSQNGGATIPKNSTQILRFRLTHSWGRA